MRMQTLTHLMGYHIVAVEQDLDVVFYKWPEAVDATSCQIGCDLSMRERLRNFVMAPNVCIAIASSEPVQPPPAKVFVIIRHSKCRQVRNMRCCESVTDWRSDCW